MQIQALGNHVCVTPIDNQSETTAGGLTLPKSQNKIIAKGIVKSVGNGEEIVAMYISEGDVIYYQEIERDLFYSSEYPEGIIFVRDDMIFGKEKG